MEKVKEAKRRRLEATYTAMYWYFYRSGYRVFRFLALECNSQNTHARMHISNRRTYIYIQVKKKAFKINAKIEDVGLNEDLKSTETRNGH